jgi:primase-polymerase (primpol)-like protein
MPTPTCEHCPAPLPITARRHARYCSTRCRVAAHRVRRRTLPDELTSRPRWVRRTAAKVPVAVDGAAASSTDPETWSRYSDASKSTAGAGLGFVLNGDGVVCLDLDHCLYGDRVAPWAQRILDAAGPTWVERSVSGDGLHVWGYGELPHGRRVSVGTGTVELYGTGRYIAVTGDTWGDTPRRLGDLSAVIHALL